MARPTKGGNEGAFEFYPRFPMGQPSPHAYDVFDIRNLPPLRIEIEETEDQAGWGPAAPQE